jgi:endonuclease-3
MKRVNQRLGLTRSSDPNAIERDLMGLIPRTEWTGYTRRVIHHGRSRCTARKPQCGSCPLGADCPWPAGAAAGEGAERR